MTDLLVVVGLTLAACLVVGLAGAGVLHLGRRRSFGFQLAVATLVPVLAVAATVAVNVNQMFLSTHDSGVVSVALVVSVGLAALLAALLTRRVLAGAAEVEAGLRRLVADTARDQADGQPTGAPEAAAALPEELAAVVRDLGETRRTLAEARARERAAEQSRRELVAFLSHDLRTPLAGLRALSEALEDGLVTDVPATLRHLRGSVDRMAALVDDLFALSRVQGTRTSRVELVSLAEVLGDLTAENAALAQARAVRLELDLPAEDRLAVLGSADDLTRALGNLVANALHYTPTGRTVEVRGHRADDGRVQVAVVDGCGGIAADALPRVFDTGWRGSPARTGDSGGAGLGLAIAQGVVASHAGRIAVQNVEGGCRFDVLLPTPTAADAS